jgi:hypothetical protein
MALKSGDSKFRELYRYKVVYPGGIFVRSTPSLEAEKTGEILEFGDIFEASKSLFLDGINYVKISDGRGWVFGHKGEAEILELIEVLRLPITNIYDHEYEFKTDQEYYDEEYPHETMKSSCNEHDMRSTPSKSSSSLTTSSSMKLNVHKRTKLHRDLRHENKYWRDIRSECAECLTFYDYIFVACSLDTHPPDMPEPGPARAAWMAEAGLDGQVRNNISLITSITRQCADLADMTGLEACLWVFVHLGPKIKYILDLIDEAATARFEMFSQSRQTDLLYVAMEVSARTKPQSIELGKLMDVLPDNIRSFLQRWIMIKVTFFILSSIVHHSNTML